MKIYSTTFLIVFLFITYLSANITFASPDVPVLTDSKQVTDDNTTELEKIKNDFLSELSRGGFLSPTIYKYYLEFIDDAFAQKKIDDNIVYKKSFEINRLLDKLVGHDEFKQAMRLQTKRMWQASYTDQLHYNRNLSDQLQDRFVNMVETLRYFVNNPDEITPEVLTDISDDLGYIADRYVEASRFGGGVGLSYDYMPTVTYYASTKVDFSPYQTDLSSATHNYAFRGRYEDNAYPAINLLAKVPYGNIRLGLPSYEARYTEDFPVLKRKVEGIGGNVFYRSSLTSTLMIHYDASFNLSAKEIFFRLFDLKTVAKQADFGLGVGVVGMEIQNQFENDVRFQTDSSISFDDIDTNKTFTTTEKHKFTCPYTVIYYDFKLVYELTVGFSYKFYWDNDDELTVKGNTLSFNVNWYPTKSPF